MSGTCASNRPFRVNFVPDSWDGPWVIECNILLKFLEKVLARPVEIVNSHENSDLSFVYLFPIRDELERCKNRGWSDFVVGRGGGCTVERILRRLPVAENALIVATENLDYFPWAETGHLIRQSHIPRVSFYPEEIDPAGARVPYWWNYLDWPQYPRPNVSYARFGRLYSLDRLMSPIKHELTERGRKNRAVYISSHRAGIRDSILRMVEKSTPVDTFGKAGNMFNGPKIQVMEDYRFAIASENSLGFGYVTEKLPEAWDAGCIPLGIFSTPFSDFRYQALTAKDAIEAASRPLLEEIPDESRVLNYLSSIL